MAENNGFLLHCRDVTVRFGGVMALNDVSFTAREGAISALIGPNGAGKTTMLNAVTGMVPLADGQILFDGRDLSEMQPHTRSLAGVVRTFQNLEVFSNMTVLENVMTGRHGRIRYSFLHALLKTPRYLAGERECREHAIRALEFVGLEDKLHYQAKDLPFGSQRLLEIARAIVSEPKLLLLDEPAAGLNMKETKSLGAIIRCIREELGISIALVEHDMSLVMDISDEITVLNFGTELAKGTPQEVQKNPDVITAYLGEDED